MPVIDKYAVLNAAFRAAKHIDGLANDLASVSGAIPFNSLQGRLDGMRESYAAGVQPMLDLGTQAQVNAVVGTFYAGTLPANTHGQFQQIGSALMAFYGAYDAIFETLTPIEFDPGSGHSFASIPLVQLSTLSDELNAIIAATAPLI